MFTHDLRVTWRSLQRTPFLAVLMIFTMAIGIAATMATFTLYHARSGHPIPSKDNSLYAVTLDPRDEEADFGGHPEYPPLQLTYRDARALYASAIPMRSVMMYKTSEIVSTNSGSLRPFSASIRVTTADFFLAFDVPFLYGSGWSRSDDDDPSAVVVISRYINQKLFRGENSVGRDISLDGRLYRVIGVINSWAPRPKYYDATSPFDIPEDIFMPFGWMSARELEPTGRVMCVSKRAHVVNFDSLLTEDCVWLQLWVEFRYPVDRARFQSFADNYTDDWRSHGRFPRKNNNRIVNVTTWLQMLDVVGDDSRIQVLLALVFLGVCLVNTFGLMLAKLLAMAPIFGLRRALGASRMNIVRQHFFEVMAICVAGGVAGTGLSAVILSALKVLMYSGWLDGSDNPDEVALVRSFVHMDFAVGLLAIGLSFLSGCILSVLLAQRVVRMEPSTFLKVY
jgi:putative ABC transport system permease protein